MPHIAAFRGLRYDLGHVGALDGVVAPPSSAIDKDLQSELYKQHPSNVVRLILNRDELGDKKGAKFERAGVFFRNWQREGVLQREPDPAIYAYHQVFDHEGRTYTRRGFICLTRLDETDETIVSPKPLEPSAVEDQLRLRRASKASLSPVLGLYADEDNLVQEILEDSIINVVPIEAKDRAGVIHRIWPLSDIHIINDVASAMATESTYIAHGRDHYHAALEYKKELGQDLDPTLAANFVMMTFVSTHDSGMSMFELDDADLLQSESEELASLETQFTPALLNGLVFSTHDA